MAGELLLQAGRGIVPWTWVEAKRWQGAVIHLALLSFGILRHGGSGGLLTSISITGGSEESEHSNVHGFCPCVKEVAGGWRCGNAKGALSTKISRWNRGTCHAFGLMTDWKLSRQSDKPRGFDIDSSTRILHGKERYVTNPTTVVLSITSCWEEHHLFVPRLRETT